jgi:hypothetical protein
LGLRFIETKDQKEHLQQHLKILKALDQLLEKYCSTNLNRANIKKEPIQNIATLIGANKAAALQKFFEANP